MYGKEGLNRGSGASSRQDFSNAEFMDPFSAFGGFGGFHFRSPHDIFEEFFGTKNIFDLFDDQMFANHHHHHHHHPFRRQTSDNKASNGGSSSKRHRNNHSHTHSNLHDNNIMQAFFGFPNLHDFGLGHSSGYVSIFFI